MDKNESINGITKDLIDQVLKDDNLECESFELLGNETAHEVFLIRVKTNNNLHLKFFHKSEQNIKSKINNEVNVLKYLSINSSIPVPTLYSHDNSTENCFKREYILTSVCDGTPLSEIFPDVILDRKKEYVKVVAKLVNEIINTTTFTSIGSFVNFDESTNELEVGEDVLTQSGPYDKFSGYIKETTGYFLDRYVKSHKKFSKYSEAIQKFFDQKINSIKVDNKFVLCHTNLSLRNIYVNKNTKEITGVSGWGESFSNIPFYCYSSFDIFSEHPDEQEPTEEESKLEDFYFQECKEDDDNEKLDELNEMEEVLYEIADLNDSNKSSSDIKKAEKMIEDDILDILEENKIDYD